MAKGQRFWKEPEFYFSLVLFTFIVTVLALSVHLSSKAKLIPIIVAIGALPLTLVNLLACLFPQLRDKVSAVKAGNFISIKRDESQEKTQKPPAFSDFLKVVLWFTGAYVVFFFAGYLPMVISFSILYLKLRVGFTWTRSVVITGVFGLATWAIFTLVLGLEPFGIQYYY